MSTVNPPGRRVERLCLDIEQRGQTIPQTHLLDMDVFVEEFDLLGETNFRPGRRIERQPEQIAEPRDHSFGGGQIAMHQRRDRMQRSARCQSTGSPPLARTAWLASTVDAGWWTSINGSDDLRFADSQARAWVSRWARSQRADGGRREQKTPAPASRFLL